MTLGKGGPTSRSDRPQFRRRYLCYVRPDERHRLEHDHSQVALADVPRHHETLMNCGNKTRPLLMVTLLHTRDVHRMRGSVEVGSGVAWCNGC